MFCRTGNSDLRKQMYIMPITFVNYSQYYKLYIQLVLLLISLLMLCILIMKVIQITFQIHLKGQNTTENQRPTKYTEFVLQLQDKLFLRSKELQNLKYLNSPKNLVKKTEAEIIQFWGQPSVGLITTILTLFILTAEVCIYTLKHMSSFKQPCHTGFFFH